MNTSTWRGKFEYIIHPIQVVLLNASYYISRIIIKRKDVNYKWAIGVDEVSGLIFNIGSVLDKSKTVCLNYHPFYENVYDYSFLSKIKSKYLNFIFRIFYPPLLMGYLCQRVRGFIYIGGSGYLFSENDGRDYEFNFLSSKNIKIVCYFSGSEIRSTVLMAELGERLVRDVCTTYQFVGLSEVKLNQYETKRKKLAESADTYADMIFNAKVDQISYIKKITYPFLYFYPDWKFRFKKEKFEKIKKIKIVHAPSNPFPKGTPLVRSAIKKLKEEGFNFEYHELIGVKHEVVMNELESAHIVLNEFYAFMPGVFGVEAMASHCALLTSADENIETSLPRGSNSAWLVTEYWNIYDNLKILMIDHELLKKYANSGYEWAKNNCSYSSSGNTLRAILAKLN